MLEHRAFQHGREKNNKCFYWKEKEALKHTLATAVHCQLAASKRRQQDIDLWRLSATEQRQRLQVESDLGLERTPVEYHLPFDCFCGGL